MTLLCAKGREVIPVALGLDQRRVPTVISMGALWSPWVMRGSAMSLGLQAELLMVRRRPGHLVGEGVAVVSVHICSKC